MGFDTLLGNERLKENLVGSLSKGHISHFYLISGPEGSGKHTLAKLLSAAILCRGHGKPCLSCGPCRKVMEGNHPDLITVTDPEHKNVAVKIVRAMREDMFIRPNESDYKIYLFPQELGIEGQNALLKILEEPPKYGVFLLLTDNPDKLLPTVRSRCTELKLLPLAEPLMKAELTRLYPSASPEDIIAAMARSGGLLGQAKALLESGEGLPVQTESFVKAFSGRDALGLTQVLVPMEKWKRDQVAQILQSWLEILECALVSRSGVHTVSPHARAMAQTRTAQEIYDAAQAIQKALDYVKSNVSPAAVCGWLCWELR